MKTRNQSEPVNKHPDTNTGSIPLEYGQGNMAEGIHDRIITIARRCRVHVCRDHVRVVSIKFYLFTLKLLIQKKIYIYIYSSIKNNNEMEWTVLYSA